MADLSDIPAEFFSTFSVADPCNPAPGHAKAQKRNRRVFVCIPCHRRKLKCDKLLPCSRCVASEIANECAYMPPPSSPAKTDRAKMRRKKEQERETERKNSLATATTEIFAANPNPATQESSPALSASSIDSSPPSSSLSSPSPSPTCRPAADPATRQSASTKKRSAQREAQDADEQTYARPERRRTTRDSTAATAATPLNGASHWSRIVCEFTDAVPYLFGTDPQWQHRYRQVKSLKCLFPSLDDNVNFPFSNASPTSKAQILASLPPSHMVDALVTRYLDTFGATHCLFYGPQLQYEVRRFCGAPTDVPDAWLAQLCMVLSLGAESTADFLFSGSGQSAAGWASTLLNLAQAAFGRSSYMAVPTLVTVRTLCMMVLAKLAESPASGGSCSGGGKNTTNGYTPLVSLMAFTVRTATSLQLHRSLVSTERQTTAPGSEEIDKEMRRRIWVTVRLLDIDTALRAGTTPLIRQEACDAEPPQPLADGSSPRSMPGSIHMDTCKEADCGCTRLFKGYGKDGQPAKIPLGNGGPFRGDPFRGDPFRGDPNGRYQHTLATAVPLLSSIVDAVNAPAKPSPGLAHTKAWDKRVHALLEQAKTALLSSRDTADDAAMFGGIFVSASLRQIQRAAIIQAQFLETLANRALLALHHNDFCQSLQSPRPAAHTKASQTAVVKSALALLSIHQKWAAAATNLTGSCPGTCTDTTSAAATTAHPAASVNAPLLSILQQQQAQQQSQQHPTLVLAGQPSPTVFGGSGAAASWALSQEQQGLSEPPPPANASWLLDVCHDDFAAALLYLALAMRAALRDDSRPGSVIAVDDAALVAVHHSYCILRGRSFRSVAHFSEFLGVAIVFATFRGLQSGDILASVVEAANDVEQTVGSGRRYLFWAASSFGPAANPIPGPVPGPVPEETAAALLFPPPAAF